MLTLSYDKEENVELIELNILEEKIKKLLVVLTELQTENKNIKENLKEGNSAEGIIDTTKRDLLKQKINDMLKLLENV